MYPYSWTVPISIALQYFLLLKVGAASNSSAGPTNTPSPISVPPSEDFDGNDGPWSSFFMQIGTPPQIVTVFISTAGNQPWVAIPQACQNDTSDCIKSRGGVFKSNCSSTWEQNNFTSQGIFSLALEQNLGLTGNGLYGYDTVALSYLGSGLPSLDHQVVAGIATPDFWMGQFGLNPAASNFSSFNHPVQSYMGALKSQNMIPSLSYGYTAGNQYRFNKVLASLTLGGYDAAIFEPNELTIPMSSAAVSDLTVNINSITFSSGNASKWLSSTPFSALIDSTVPYLYLPIDVCEKFEDAFSITYDSATELYLVNDTLHSQLLSQAANVTFTLTNLTAQVVVDIVLPYQAFDLMAEYPLVKNSTRYFPLKRSQNNTQNTLGRTFLQEAYVVADYERSNFSIYQRKWDANTKTDIQAILPVEGKASEESNQSAFHPKVSVAVILGVAVGAVVLVTVLIGFIVIIRRQNRKLRALKDQPATEPSIKPCKEGETSNFATGNPISELDGVETLLMNPELDASGVYELPANEAVGSELYSPAGKGKTASLRQRELEHQRNALRHAQFSQRRRFIQDDPQFEFGSIAQTVLPQPPQFQSPTWTAGELEGRLPLTRAWSSPSISPNTSERQCSNPEGHECCPNEDNAHELPHRSKFGSI